MSGAGSRFARAGYTAPKPLIPVDGKPMIRHVIEMFPGVTDFIFICRRDHLETTELESVLRSAAPTGRIVAIEPHKFGPVYATLRAENLIADDEPVVVNYTDFSVVWDFRHFEREMRRHGCHGALTAYRGFHPHSLGPNLYAYLRHDRNRLIEIREKHCFTANRMEEYASSGTYYFRSGALLKTYYRRAIAEGLSTNGEYYSSMPYNLMVRDGLTVQVYELERFLQWGTPEDLEEYQSWSDYFNGPTARTAERPHRGATVVPMAGDGVRFAREGYREPKPLVPVAGAPMIARSLTALPKTSRTVAICRSEHLKSGDLGRVLAMSRSGTTTLELTDRTEGQACTCLLAESHIDVDEPVLVAPCDCAVLCDENRLEKMVANSTTDAIAFTFVNHPHANRNPLQYGWVSAGKDGLVTSAVCKKHPAGEVRRAHGITGMFWFRRAGLLFDSIRELMRRDARVNGEFYLDSVLPLLIEGGQCVRALDAQHYICFGTPDDVRTYEYWESCFRERRQAHEREAAVVDRFALLQRSA
jgi:NDP-sugar pyrophosphorylase family protein